jgi:PAS domain S-box-containing protein
MFHLWTRPDASSPGLRHSRKLVMSYAPTFSIVVSLLPCIIPPYAFRLNRVFGTQRVGWVIFGVFLLLGALQLMRSWHPFGLGISTGLTLDLLSLLIPALLLIGMAHIESLFKERLRVEQEEKRMRGELELQVKQRTAALDSANEELQREISLRKQGAEELRKSKEEYRFLFEENPQPMWIFDLRSFRFLSINKAALRAYGFSHAEFKAMTAKDLCVPEEISAFVAECAKGSPAMQTQRIWKHCKKDASTIEVEISAVDLMYSGYPARLVVAYDVTAL